jgi:tRNA(Ile)-lysidine synthase
MHPLETQVRRLWLDLDLPATGVVVGVSAGPDSMALLHLLAVLRAGCIPWLLAAYIDHGLRPDETLAEWDCVRETAARLELACARERIDVTALARERKLSLEHAARELRYQALNQLARARDAGLIAVAHTADDQVEEVLLRLLRGGGRKALSGMRPRSGNLIRPLLAVPKSELLAYLAHKRIPFCHDSSNDDPRFLRNRIRQHLLPLLERDYDPGVREALLKTAGNLAEDEDLLDALMRQQWPAVVDFQAAAPPSSAAARIRRNPFNRLHPSLQRRLIEQLLWRLGDATTHAHILIVLAAAQRGQTGNELHLARGLRVRIRRESLEFSFPKGAGSRRGRLYDD